MNRLILICLVAVFAAVCGDDASIHEGRNRLKNIHTKCQSDPSTQVDEEVLQKFHNGEKIERSEVSAHILCMAKAGGVINEDGSINEETIKKIISREVKEQTKLDEILSKCAVKKGTPEDTAVELSQCLQNNSVFKLRGLHHGHHRHGHHGHGQEHEHHDD